MQFYTSFRRSLVAVCAIMLPTLLLACSNVLRGPATPIPLTYQGLCGTLPSCGLPENRFSTARDALLVIGEPIEYKRYLGLVDDHNNAGGFLYDPPTPCDPAMTNNDVDTTPLTTGTWTIKTEEKGSISLALKANLTQAIPELAAASAEAQLNAATSTAVDQAVEFQTSLLTLKNAVSERYRANSACNNPDTKKFVRDGIILVELSGGAKKNVKNSLSGSLKADATLNVGLFDVQGNLTAEASAKIDSALNATFAKNRWIIAVGWYE